MRNGLIAFAVGAVVIAWGISLGAYALSNMEGGQTLASFIQMFSGLLVFGLAFICHRISGAVGNPFRGLTWGAGGLLMLSWIGGIGLAVVAMVIIVGLGIQQIDMEMTAYFSMVAEQMQKQGTPDVDAAIGMMKSFSKFQIYIGPILGSWFLAATMCLGLFPWFGWFTRRLLVFGKAKAIGILIALYIIIGLGAGLIDNPMMADVSIPTRMGLMALFSAAILPISLWFFLKSKSVVIASLIQASYISTVQSIALIMTWDNMLLGIPSGIIPVLVIGAAGIALWLWQDPGGGDLAIAAVAFDGSPMTPEQVEDFHRQQAEHDTQLGQQLAEINDQGDDPFKTLTE